jgi:predicted Na+-dependent transporter
VSVRDYVVGTCASLPALLGYVFLGRIAAAGLASGQAGWLHWTMLAVGALATIGLTLRIGQLLSRARLVPASMQDAVSVALRRPRGSQLAPDEKSEAR